RDRDVHVGRRRASGADLIRARPPRCAGGEGRLRRQQGGGVVTGRVAARRVPVRADQDHRARTRLHRIGDDGALAVHDADGRHRNRGAGDGGGHRTRSRTRRRAGVAVAPSGPVVQDGAGVDVEEIRMSRLGPVPRRVSVALVSIGAVVALTVTGCLSVDTRRNSATTTPEAPATTTEAPTGPSTPSGPVGPAAGFADVVERVGPSVVTVRTGDGVGSGVVYRPNIIITNAHVVGRAREVVLTFADREEAAGEVLATDTITDLAVVRSTRGKQQEPEYRTELPRLGTLDAADDSMQHFD